MFKWLQNRRLAKKNKNTWLTVGFLKIPLHSSADRYASASVSLKENILGDRTIQVTLQYDKSYVKPDIENAHMYKSIVMPWLSGINFDEIPSYFDVSLDVKKQYVNI